MTYLHVSVQYFTVVQRLEASYNLDEDVPDLLLLDVGLSFLVAANLLEHVTIVCILHYEAQTGARFVDESFFVSNYVLLEYARQNAHLVQGVFLFFLRQVKHLNLLQRVDCLILRAAHLVNLRVGTVT